MDDDLYGAFLRADIFGKVPLTVRVVPAKQGDGFVVSAQWEYLDECFASREEWEAFAAKMEERMGMAALGAPGESEFGERLSG